MKTKKFNFSKVVDFEKHIELSIPNFLTLDNIFSAIGKEFAQPESGIIDLGCSTGRFLSKFKDIDNVNLYGIDTVKFDDQRSDNFIFEQLDIEEALEKHMDDNISVIVGMFMLQFLGQKKRERVLKKLKHYVANKNTTLLIAEKVFLTDSRLQTLIHRLHIQEKRKGFTDTEILDKDDQLAVSMYCKNERELNSELNHIGVSTKVWQSYNFMGFCIKNRSKNDAYI